MKPMDTQRAVQGLVSAGKKKRKKRDKVRETNDPIGRYGPGDWRNGRPYSAAGEGEGYGWRRRKKKNTWT